MFDIGFLELLVIGVIALIVLGPERLPKAARTVGIWVGKAKQGFNSIKTEIDRELKIQEIRQQLKDQKAQLEQQLNVAELKDALHQTQEDIQQVTAQTKQSIKLSPTANPSEPTSPSEPINKQNDPAKPA